ncbi:hypothetical protein [Nocardia sp. NPDC051570]|uniref:hypothetical protein n=1 Tax=Nocardia sp. NPDC051570 TaxID=3364324 RepID=UPI0037B5E88A
MRKLRVYGVTCAAVAGIVMAGAGVSAAATPVGSTGSSSGSVSSGSTSIIIDLLKLLKILDTGSGSHS